jgi:hypothetical protein
VIENHFTVPLRAAIGPAQYYIEIAYPNCAFAGRDEIILQNSPTLDFVIK